MFDPKYFDEVAKKLFSSLPAGIQNLEKDMQERFKEILQSAFSRLDLVTRDEFDIQSKVLARTREKLEALEGQVNLLVQKQTAESK